MARSPGQHHADVGYWRQCVHHWFPRLLERTYFVPPVYMNRVHYELITLAGINVDITQPPVREMPRGAQPALQLSHVREDQTQQRILHCLQELAEVNEEPMIVVSQLQFGDYLRNPCYAAAASMLPRPFDLRKEEKHRGDFDLLVIHKHHGLLAAEIKTVGDNFASLSGLTEQRQDDLVAKKVQQAVKQLNKSGDVLRHLVSDQQRPAPVRKTLMLPNITRLQLQRVLLNHPTVRQQELCQCLDIQDTSDLLDTCLCADHLSDMNTPCDVTADVLKRLSDWWTRIMAGPRISLTDEEYVELVARFCGPATTVQVFCAAKAPGPRSVGEGVAETSRRFTRIVLHPHQVDVLNQNRPLVFLCGPPGTGKTLVLVVRALDWLHRGWEVHVISTWSGSMAASYLIVHQLQQSAGHRARQHVHLHVFDFKEKGQVEAAVKCLVAAASRGPLCVVVDEVPQYGYSGQVTTFCTELYKHVPGLRLWAASVHHGRRPPCLTEVPMAEPLRTPPVVTREVQESVAIKQRGDVRDYIFSPAPAPCDGPITHYLYHSGPDHSEGSPVDCKRCGEHIARILTELHVGVTGPVTVPGGTSDAASPPTSSPSSKNKATATIPAPLTYSDVFLLTVYKDHFHDEERDTDGNLVRPASSFVRVLRERGIPVRVVQKKDASALQDVALQAGPEAVVATEAGAVRGLERKVVIVVQTGMTATGTTDEWYGRLDAASRTTAQLIWVVYPSNKASAAGGGDHN